MSVSVDKSAASCSGGPGLGSQQIAHGFVERIGECASQLDLPSLTPLSVAGSGRLRLGVVNCSTSVASNLSS